MINLLPPQQQQQLHQDRVKRLVVILGFIGVVFLITLALVLLAVHYYIKGQIAYEDSVLQAKRGESHTAQIEEIQQQFKTYNEKMVKINEFYQQQHYPTQLLKELENELPPFLYLKSFSYQQGKQAQVFITGWAPTREVLYQFRENLIKKDRWKDIYFPPSNWVSATSVEFRIRFNMEYGAE